jgi:hypothetical protein
VILGHTIARDPTLDQAQPAHKLTTDLTRQFETIVIEGLNVCGMAKNHSLAGAVLDCGFHEIRRAVAVQGGDQRAGTGLYGYAQSVSASAVDQPRTETVLTIEHI